MYERVFTIVHKTMKWMMNWVEIYCLCRLCSNSWLRNFCHWHSATRKAHQTDSLVHGYELRRRVDFPGEHLTYCSTFSFSNKKSLELFWHKKAHFLSFCLNGLQFDLYRWARNASLSNDDKSMSINYVCPMRWPNKNTFLYIYHIFTFCCLSFSHSL